MTKKPSANRAVEKQLVVGVDDDLQVRESLEALVASAGLPCVVFSSAEEFLASKMLSQATCLVVDVRMSEMDGLSLQREVRRQQPKTPIIFISAHYDEEVRRRALAEGAIDFFYKPFDAALLLRTIENASSHHTGARLG